MSRANRLITFSLLVLLLVVGIGLAPQAAAAQEKPSAVDEKTTVFEEVPVAAEGKPEYPWFVTLLGGEYSGSQLLEIPARFNLQDSYTFGVSVSKQFARWTRFMRWEVELQVLKHFGEQDNWEFTGSVNLRWVVFPWNKWVETTAAVGEGLSWATEIPALEKADPTNSDNAQLLNYILLEITFAVPESSWSLVTRIHHRSGVWGLFGHTGSNVLEAGIRYRF
jgi:hypothetical protein